jgi:hypothetical protein
MQRIAAIAMLALILAACTAESPGFRPLAQRPTGQGKVSIEEVSIETGQAEIADAREN